jgi:hypothetical protein
VKRRNLRREWKRTLQALVIRAYLHPLREWTGHRLACLGTDGKGGKETQQQTHLIRWGIGMETFQEARR